MRRTRVAIVGFEDGQGSAAKECGLPLTAGKVKKKDPSVEPPEWNTSLPTPWL